MAPTVAAEKNDSRPKETAQHQLDMLKKYLEYHCWVNRAKEKGRFFRISCPTNHANLTKLRKELKKRGFIEQKPLPSESVFFTMPNSILLEEAHDGNDYEQALVAKMIGKQIPDYVFLSRAIEYKLYNRVPFLSKISFKPPSFICKNGLISYTEAIRQLNLAQKCFFPRAYNVSLPEGLQEFREDFRLTACLSLVMFLHHQLQQPTTDINDWFTNEQQQQQQKQNQHPTITSSDASVADTVQINGLDYAIHVISMHIKYADGNLSKDDLARYNLNEIQWNEVLCTHAGLIRHKRKLFCNGAVPNQRDYILSKMKVAVDNIPKYWPNIRHDGYQNMWLLKPAYTGQGFGIILDNNESRLLDYIRNENNNFICQKYIERPLLVFLTKIDLRQYYLIAIDAHFIRFWSHPLCAVRIASTEFTMDNFAERAHITNTSIQRKYRRESTENLPYHHMWSTHTLEDHFEKIGKPRAWQKYIYPTIKRTLRAISKVSVENIDLRPGRFELFGCDWLITEDLKTYLIEINRCPSLYYYTPVSEYVVGTIIEDMVKVIVDFQDDKSASTGEFSLLYEYELPDSPRRQHLRQIEEENRQKIKLMDEIVRGILDDVITRVNVSPAPENQVDLSKEVEEIFDPYRQQLLSNIL